MVKKRDIVPEPPENYDQINPQLPPIDTQGHWITNSFMAPLVRKIRKQKNMYMCNVSPVSARLQAKSSGQRVAEQWNKQILHHRSTGKPMKSLLSQLFQANKKMIMLLLLYVPITSLCGVCSPIAVREFTSVLVPQTFYDCDQFFTSNPNFSTNPPKFTELGYVDGLYKAFKQLWGYLILVFCAQVVNFVAQNLSMSNLLRISTSGISGFLDLVFNKVLVLSDQTRSSSAAGNITNLLYTDTLMIATMITFIHFIVQVPIDLIIYIIYLGVQINPIALVGLTAYLILFPVVGIVIGKIAFLQKKIMSIRDMRMKRATEVLNGIKVIKLFSLEQVQHARLQNARNKEIKELFKFSICFSVFGLVASAAAPMMTAIAFVVMTYKDKFDIASAFTTMFLFQYLAFAIVMLPMLMSSLAQSLISSSRLSAFLQLPERDPGVIVKIHELDPNQRDKLPQEVLNEEVALKVTGKPSFTWNLASDKVVPPVMDPFFKDNERTTNFINKKFPLELKKYELELAKYNKSHQIQPAVEIQVNVNQLTAEESEQLTVALTKESKDMVLVDKWCLAFDVPFVSRLQSLEQYNFTNYVPERKHTELDRLKLQAIHLQTMRFYMNKNNNADLVDGPAVVKNLDIEIKKGDIIGVCGQVGQGKTSFFNAILGEMRLTDSSRTKLSTYMSKDGIKPIYNDYDLEKVQQEDPRFDSEIPHIYVNGTIAYFSQACHIFSKSARQNILFNKPYDAEKYKRVVEMCCLKDDFAILAAGDQTEVGGKGVTLSGGQKARLSLARAIYSDASIYLLDDPLSAVDAHVGKTIWNDAILGYLKSRGATVIIASHQTQYFNDCDKIIQITDGEIVNYDTVQNLMKDNVKIIGITGETSTQHSQITTQVIKEVNIPQTVQEEIKSTDSQAQQQKSEQLSASGNVKLTVYKKWVTSGSIALSIITLLLLVTQTGINQYQTIMVSHWASDKYGWTAKENKTSSMSFVMTNCVKANIDPFYCGSSDFLGVDTPNVVQAILHDIDQTNYAKQFALRAQVVAGCIDYKNAKYSMTPIKSSNNYLWLYIGLTGGVIIFNFLGNIAFSSFCLSVARKLHDTMLGAVLRTKMGFFDTTPQGRIMNRFSKDTDAVDSGIMRYLQGGVMTGLMILGMIISIAVVNYPCLVVIIPGIVLFGILFVLFRLAYPQVKRLEAITRSPVFSICQESVDSLVSIRAFALEEKQKTDFRAAVNINSSLYFQQYSLMRWLVFRLGMLTSCFAFLISFIAMLIAPYSQNIAQYTGIIVSYGFSISNILMQFVITLVSLDGEMASVERLDEYGNLPAEGKFVKKDANLDPNWPRNNSGIEVKNLQFRYRPELDLVLKKLDFKLQPKEHIGIVGRTGAGKSSITVAMYRLAEPDKGSEIIVDGVNILDLGLHQARKAFTIIPQDPFLFSGTLRQCLCPYSQADAEGVKTEGLERIDDKRMWEALEQVQMKEYFLKQPGQLDSKIATNGDNLSAGQKQLVCVARALLRKASCVILDEATAQVDRENDQLIQQTIRNAFSEVTVLSIAHRLDTIIDFDRIIVMDKGNIAEFDTPANLVRKEGVFFELVNKTGAETSEKLKKAAFQAERQRQAGEKVNVDID
ncbi:Xenobiotic-transporting_ATPase / Multidrug resistance-associated protein [Hexamita inflata]|uniref:Xenobiotic-transporting ATPase / Multidrug resistance-associated protein n=1 Tax=Hexamita inflata TaxID=28002 RepID=A0AA86TLX0_9EUKA|nr:Xenobiotic-transporting ATPase / Multidrug resistance-associated protein [Hexamita inflata]CAI9959922.1 Xenobiotic-transporting ATPase / Multidrug resistance-associated protein [Hexamita inflata]